MKNSNGMNKLKKLSVHLLALTFLVIPVMISAQIKGTGNNPPITGSGNTSITFKIPNPFKCGTGDNDKCTLMSLITTILNNIIMPIAAVGIVLYIMYAGFKFVIAQGNPKKIEEAQQMLLWAMIGAGVLLGAAGIAKVVENTVGALLK